MKRDPEKAAAWRRRSKPLSRGSTPLKRAEIARTPTRPREPRIMRPASAKTARRRADAREVRSLYLAARPYCEIARAGIGTPCFGAIHPHEVWTRGRGGPLDDVRNLASACDRHNTDVSQDADAMAFAYAHDLLVHRRDGAAWLGRGGRWPGLSKADAEIALFGRTVTA